MGLKYECLKKGKYALTVTGPILDLQAGEIIDCSPEHRNIEMFLRKGYWRLYDEANIALDEGIETPVDMSVDTSPRLDHRGRGWYDVYTGKQKLNDEAMRKDEALKMIKDLEDDL